MGKHFAFRNMAGGVRGLSPRGCETAAPWHKSCGHLSLEEQMFPIRELGWWLVCSCASPGQSFLLVLAPVSPL